MRAKRPFRLSSRTHQLHAPLAGLLLLMSLAPRIWPEEGISQALDLARQLNRAFVEVAEQVSPSVVVVRVAHRPGANGLSDPHSPLLDMLPPEFREQFEERFRGPEGEAAPPKVPRDPVFDGQGSGVVIRKDGYILTNRHVVEGADKIKVKFLDGTEYDATVRGEDGQSDLAVLKIEADNLKAAKIGDSAQTKVGEFAIAIGAPFELDYTVTFGHVSAKGRSQIIRDPSMDQDFIQTDADINPGNSGGPLVNIEGEVIGINTLIRGLRTGIGFAIPINLVMEVSERLISEGKYVRAWLGIEIVSLNEQTEFRELVTGVKQGVVVKAIQPNGPAAHSELRANDIITAVNGQAVRNAIELKSAIRTKKIGSDVIMNVHRLEANEAGDFKGKDIEVSVTLEAWPENLMALTAPVEVPKPQDAAKALGLTVESLTQDLADTYGVEKMKGVIVTEVEQSSPAGRKGLRPGDIITEVNQKPVTTPKEFRTVLESANLAKGVIINFTSRGTSRFEILKENAN